MKRIKTYTIRQYGKRALSSKVIAVIFTIIFPLFVSAQTTIFTETMGAPPYSSVSVSSYTNWSTGTTYTHTGTATLINSWPNSSGYTGSSGNGPVELVWNGSAPWWQMAGINTSSYTSLSLSFGIYKKLGSSTGAPFMVEVSSDGINYTALSFTALPAGGGTEAWYYRTCTGTIPSASNLRIRFTNRSGIWGEDYRLDDLKLVGTLACTPPPTVINGERCGTGTVTLSANGSAGTYNWYNSALGGSSLGTVSSYTTPSLSSSTTYYVSSVVDGCESPRVAVTATVISSSAHAVKFDGVNDYINISNSLQASFTLEVWIKTSVSSRTGTYPYEGNGLLWSDINGGANDFVFSILNNKLAFYDGNGNASVYGTTNLNDNVWHHVAVVRTAGSPGTIKLYVDGVQNGSTGSAGSATLTANANIHIGGNTLNGYYFNGYMDEVRVWNAARTTTEISDNRFVNLAGNETGLFKYLRLNDGTGTTATNSVSGGTNGILTNMDPTAATGPTSTSGWVTAGFSYAASPYCNSSGTASITLSSSSYGITSTFTASPSGLTLNSATGVVTLSSSIPGTYTVTNGSECTNFSIATITITADVSNPSATINYNGSPYCSSVGTASVTHTGTTGGVYTSTAGLTIDAASGVVTLGTSTAGTYIVTYSVGCSYTTTTSITITQMSSAHAIKFDGSNDYVRVSNNLQASFTIEAWIKTSVSSTTGSYVYQGNGLFGSDVGGGANDFIFSILNNKLAFMDGNAGSETYGTTNLNDNVWHHIAVVRAAGSPGTIKLFVDGVQNGTTNNAGSAVLTANANIDIGSNNLGQYFNGYMDEVRIWNVARTATEISDNRYANLAGNETGLVKYLRFNDGMGATATNSVSGEANGSLINIVTTPATGPTSTSGWVTAGFSYDGSPYCSSSGTANITLSSSSYGTMGTFTASPSGLTLNPTSGAVTLSSSTVGSYTVTNGSGCTNVSTSTITVSGPSATISAGSATTFCSGCSVTLTSSAGSSYSWSTGAVTSSINVTETGSYTVSVTDDNGCQSTSSATEVTVNTCNSHSWTGSTSSTWETGSNWNKCASPGAGDDVTIPDVVTDPIITGMANSRNLTIEAEADLTINNGTTLNVYGNINNSGTYTDSGTTILAGSSSQTVSGTTTFNNLTLNNSNGATLNNATTVKGILTLTSGTLASGGNLSVDLNTGAIAGTGTGAITGNVTLYKAVTSDRYHYISSPLSGLTVSQWNDDVAISTGTQYNNLYTYSETYTDTTKTVGWEAVRNLSAPLESMRGYALYFRGPTTLDVTGSYTHNATYSNSALTNTVSNTGGIGSPGSDGWHLMGNPYPSAIDWSASSGWTKNNVDDALYIWDPVNNRYASYINGAGTNGGTQYIPSMQAFWVKANLSSGIGTLAMNNHVRVTSTNPAIWRRAASNNLLRLSASNGAYKDETIIRFMEDAEETFDSHADAYKKSNSANTPSLYTMNSGVKYSINSLPLESEEISIPLILEAGFTGAYTLTAEEEGSFQNVDFIILEDRLLGIYQDLRSNPSYSCNLAKGDTVERFYIHFKRSVVNSTNSSHTKPASIIIKGSDQTISIYFNIASGNTASISVSNVWGQEIFLIENADISSGKYTILLPSVQSGIYIVKVVSPNQSTSGKIYLSK